MSDRTRPATWADVVTVARLLDAHGVSWALIGGYALAAHGYVRFSEDVDVLVEPSAANARRWIAALAELPDRAARELVGDEDIFEREGPYAVRINDEFTVDVLPAACGHGWAELAPHSTTVTVDGVPIRVLDLEGLLLTKQGQRDKDRLDAKILRGALDAMKRR